VGYILGDFLANSSGRPACAEIASLSCHSNQTRSGTNAMIFKRLPKIAKNWQRLWYVKLRILLVYAKKFHNHGFQEKRRSVFVENYQKWPKIAIIK
jgi:hypothetical protein